MFRTHVKSDKLELYKKHHALVWPAVEAGLRNAGLTLLSIWGAKKGNCDEEMLQMYIETKPGKFCMRRHNLVNHFPNSQISQQQQNCDEFIIAGIELNEVTGPHSAYWRSHKSVPEWETLMNSFFAKGEWALMEEIYTLTPTTSTNVTGAEALATIKSELAALED